MDLIQFVEEQSSVRAERPSFKAGDTVTVNTIIVHAVPANKEKKIEAVKEKTQLFQGVVIQRNSMGGNETFTVRKMSGEVGVERIFPLYSTNIKEITVDSRGIVRRAKLFYLRALTGKRAKIKTKRD